VMVSLKGERTTDSTESGKWCSMHLVI